MKVLPKGTIKRIHVSQLNIRKNRKLGRVEFPTFAVQTSKGPYYAFEVNVKGSSKIVERSKPLSCGARVWIETRAEVELT